MSSIKKSLFVFLACAIALLATLCFGFTIAKAETAEGADETGISSDDGQAVPYGLFTSLDFTINGKDGYVWITATNSFTLFPAKVVVSLELYSSETYQESYTDMKLESKAYIEDLNIGKSITAKAPTNGVKKYWKGRMQYKIDSKEMKEKVTKTWLYDADGIVC